MISTLIFDNDGVLVDTERLFFEANRRILEAEEIELTTAYYRQTSLRQGGSCMEIARDFGCTDADIAELRSKRDILYRELLSTEAVERDGIYEVLEATSGRYRLGVVTTTTQPLFDLIHRRTRILPYLDFVHTQEDFPRLKPHPDPYMIALERQRLNAAETLVIEDTERGINSAVAAGIRCIAAPTPLSDGGNFPGAWSVIHDLRDLLRLLPLI